MRYHFLRFPEGKTKAVTLSYDDGTIHDLRFSDVITQYGLRATFNLNGDGLHGNSPDSINSDQVREYILDRGHEVAVHGYYHKANGVVTVAEGIRDVLDCRVELERKYGRIIRGMAYPDTGITAFTNTTDYQKVRSYLSELGIVYSRTLAGDNDRFLLPDDFLSWMPSFHHSNPEAFNMIDRFDSIVVDSGHPAIRFARLLYMWGHSYEFDRDGNWDRLDSLCKRLSDCKDVWFATNMEIYEYVTAYNSLIMSADTSMIYNPTLLKIWISVDGKTITVDPGQTVTL